MSAFSLRPPIRGLITTPKWLALFLFGVVAAAAYYGALVWLLVWLGGMALGPLIG